MKLTKENIEKWKVLLDEKAEPYFGKGFSKCLDDKEWLECNEGETPDECVATELSYI